jgi:hypothetical protein
VHPFKSIDDRALDVIGKTIKRTKVKKHLALYEAALPASKRGKK